MKIDLGLAALLRQSSGEAGKAGKAAQSPGDASASTPTGRPGEVVLSSAAAAVYAADSGLAEHPVVDAGRVDAIASAVAQGRYEVQPERVADAFARFELALQRAA